MEYSKIIAVTGLPGLHELVSSKSDGAIVRSLDDKNTRFVSSRIHNFSHLESIEIYTIRDNVNLAEIFQAMEASSEPIPGEKDGKDIKGYFEKVYGEMDFERVYQSDMKKIVKWFGILKANNIEIKLTAPEELEAEPETPQPIEASAEEKPKKTAKKKVAEAAAPEETSAVEKAPRKKPAPKKSADKKAEEGDEKPAAKKAAAKKK